MRRSGVTNAMVQSRTCIPPACRPLPDYSNGLARLQVHDALTLRSCAECPSSSLLVLNVKLYAELFAAALA